MEVVLGGATTAAERVAAVMAAVMVEAGREEGKVELEVRVGKLVEAETVEVLVVAMEVVEKEVEVMVAHSREMGLERCWE